MQTAGYGKPTHQYGTSPDQEPPWNDPEVMAADLKQAIRDIEASGGPGVIE